jgi:hypothetical protein
MPFAGSKEQLKLASTAQGRGPLCRVMDVPLYETIFPLERGVFCFKENALYLPQP